MGFKGNLDVLESMIFYFFLLGVGRSSIFTRCTSAASASSASAQILISTVGVRAGESKHIYFENVPR